MFKYFFKNIVTTRHPIYRIPNPILDGLAKSFEDNVLRGKVTPVLGSVLYCDLVSGYAEHTGIYVGNNQVVHLDGSGEIEKVSADVFLNRLGGMSTGMSIYVSSDGKEAVGSKRVAERALSKVGCKRNYNVLFDNCHKFTMGCLTGDFENHNVLFRQLEEKSKKILGLNTWRVWDR